MVGSTWGPSFGARWYDDDGRPTLDTPELRGAVEHYVDLLRRAGPPRVADDGLHGLHGAATRAGRAAMTIEPANEASILYDEGGPVADGTTHGAHARPARSARATSGCTARRTRSRPARESKDAAWELAKFLCAPEQVLEDAQRSGFVEVSRNSVLETTRLSRPASARSSSRRRVATRAFARGERPVTRFGMEVGNLIGDEIVRVLTGELTSSEALQEAERTVAALGHPD